MHKMIRLWAGCCIFLMIFVVQAQDTQDTDDTYLFEFASIEVSPTQFEAAVACNFNEEVEGNADDADASEDELCTMMKEALVLVDEARETGAESFPDEALNLYHTVVKENPAYLYQYNVFLSFLSEAGNVVALPELSEKQLDSVQLQYVFSGGATEYDVTLSRTDDGFAMTGTAFHSIAFPYSEETPEPEYEVSGMIETEMIEALATSLHNFVPITAYFTDQPCWHILPDWTVTLTFDDGETLVLRNNASNVFYAGGPWQMQLDGQHYVQLDASFLQVLLDVTNTLELPYGEVASFGCADSTGIMDYIVITEDGDS